MIIQGSVSSDCVRNNMPMSMRSRNSGGWKRKNQLKEKPQKKESESFFEKQKRVLIGKRLFLAGIKVFQVINLFNGSVQCWLFLVTVFIVTFSHSQTF